MIGGVGIGRFDLPQRMKFCGGMQHSAISGCCDCEVHKPQFNKLDYDVAVNAKTTVNRGARLKCADSQKLVGQKNIVRQEGGLHKIAKSEGVMDLPSWYKLAWDARVGFACEVFHQETMGIARLALFSFFSSLNRAGQNAMNDSLDRLRTKNMWRSFPKRLAPTSDQGKTKARKFKAFAGSSYGLIMQVLVLLLTEDTWLTPHMFRADEQTRLTGIHGEDFVGGWLTPS